jgi:hypothetical protein
MKTLNEQIMEYSVARPEGLPISAKELLQLGSRAAVDQALSRLARRGQLLRSGRGLYVRPISSRFGTRAPAPEKVITEIAKQRGETIASPGAAAANALGLTTQVPMRIAYLTSGRSRRLRLGAQTIELKHAPNWQLMNSDRQSGEVLRALAWKGQAEARATLTQIKNRLTTETRRELIESRGALPEWLAKAISHELVA